jgi:hypothetical protein
VVVILAAAYIAFDLLAPRESKMRDFNADEVARLETAMWRSYYDRQQVKLFNQMTELLRSQYNLPLVRSNVVAYEAARAAFVFKDGHNRADYEKALPISSVSTRRFAKSAIYRSMRTGPRIWNWSGGSFIGSVTLRSQALWIERSPS